MVVRSFVIPRTRLQPDRIVYKKGYSRMSFELLLVQAFPIYSIPICESFSQRLRTLRRAYTFLILIHRGSFHSFSTYTSLFIRFLSLRFRRPRYNLVSETIVSFVDVINAEYTKFAILLFAHRCSPPSFPISQLRVHST